MPLMSKGFEKGGPGDEEDNKWTEFIEELEHSKMPAVLHTFHIYEE